MNDEFDDVSFDDDASNPLLEGNGVGEDKQPNGHVERHLSTDSSDSSDEPNTEDERDNVNSAIEEALIKDKRHSGPIKEEEEEEEPPPYKEGEEDDEDNYKYRNGEGEEDEGEFDDEDYEKTHNPFFADEEDTF